MTITIRFRAPGDAQVSRLKSPQASPTHAESAALQSLGVPLHDLQAPVADADQGPASDQDEKDA